MSSVTVIKLDHKGQETWRYQGNVIERQSHCIILEAHFDREDTYVDSLVLRRGDRFVETYFDDRWYNIFEVHDRVDDHLKGWYCNIGSPAAFRDQTVSYRDLALDLLVLPDGRQLVLDEDEFADLPLKQAEREKAWEALAELQKSFEDKGLSWLRRRAS
ncbi:MAG: DUF402 domain-containing protein [Anaerolineales bacterium]|jgi:predicted RNA-binding protein associated with RNAse of E/G family